VTARLDDRRQRIELVGVVIHYKNCRHFVIPTSRFLPVIGTGRPRWPAVRPAP
jgi:hypothetical protein